MSKRKIISAVIFSVLTVFVYVFFVFPLNHYSNGSEFLVTSYEYTVGEGIAVGHKMYGLLEVPPEKEQRANIGGFPIAMALYTDGVIVDETAPVETHFGRVNPASHLKRGDFITELNGEKVSSSVDIERIISAPDIGVIPIKIIRAGEEKTLEICPAKEEFSNIYRLGIVIRDYLLGVGMVTYVNDNGNFAALGHPISDGLAGKVPIRGGVVYDCEQVGITKGERGMPGELRVKIDASRKPIGEIYKSTASGVYGKLNSNTGSKNYPVASRKQVKIGDAFIYTTLGGESDYYKAEIIRAVSQSEYADKGLILRITDQRLLNLTGGIVQGMSGSPIVQNDRIIGAVTHVFVNDPTKGYGIYMDFMYEK